MIQALKEDKIDIVSGPVRAQCWETLGTRGSSSAIWTLSLPATSRTSSRLVSSLPSPSPSQNL